MSEVLRARPLLSTYRLQLNAGFTLHDARARLPYLEALGISHLYLSPVLAAREGSMHGYDVTDPTHVSDVLGGEAALVALSDDAHARGMGIMLDIVPNHMGICADNPYWDDVLLHGRKSRFAEWFDVSWKVAGRNAPSKILLPVLGDALETVIARGEITVENGDAGDRVCYFGQSFPLDRSAAVPGDDLATLLERQHYRLAYWKVAQRDLNYRRFFDVNELVSLRVEREDVLEATHEVVLGLVERGIVDALRVDHIDGLLEPRRYLERLRHAVNVRRPGGADGQHIPILVEKILAYGESLAANWPVDGTTGYELLTAVDDILLDPAGLRAIERRYRGVKTSDDFMAVAVAAKRRVLRATLNPDVRRIAPMLASLTRHTPSGRATVAECARVIVEWISHLPVYRTYIDAEHVAPTSYDREVIERTIQTVRAQGVAGSNALASLEWTLLGDWGTAPPAVNRERLTFVLRLQQLSGPAAAKGVEDTALYAYAPLASRAEVGGSPGSSIANADTRLHDMLAERATRWPRSLNATSTHDTKRTADARARLDALTEFPDEWEQALKRWTQRHRASQRLVRGRLAPDKRAQDFIYQALLAVWPSEPSRDADTDALMLLRTRIAEYMTKAIREAKVDTNWTDPNTDYEALIHDFVVSLFDTRHGSEFRREVDQLVQLLAPATRWNMLSRLVLHLSSPGVPDVYQGDELWTTALVDPDNRRAVDWATRSQALARLPTPSFLDDAYRQYLIEVRDAMDPSALKLAVTRALLELRQRHPGLESVGEYEPIRTTGRHAGHVLAFRRREPDGAELVVAVVRRTRHLGRLPLADAWGDTQLHLPHDEPLDWHCAVQGIRVASSAGTVSARDLFTVLPAAVLLRYTPDTNRSCSE